MSGTVLFKINDILSSFIIMCMQDGSNHLKGA